MIMMTTTMTIRFLSIGLTHVQTGPLETRSRGLGFERRWNFCASENGSGVTNFVFLSLRCIERETTPN